MSTIKLKRSAVQGKVPTISDLALGEIAINTYDGKVYIKKDDGTPSIVEVGDGSSSNTAVNNFITTDSFIGNGSNTQFTLSEIPANDSHVFVSINGVAQEVGTYSVNNDIIILDEVLANNASLEVRTFSSVFAGENLNANSITLTTSSNNQIVDSFSISKYRTAKYIVQMSNAGNYHSTEILLMHDDTTVYMTEYAKITSNADLGVIDSEISSNNVNLLVTPTSANTIIKTIRLSLGT